jgi:hypothetical protein
MIKPIILSQAHPEPAFFREASGFNPLVGAAVGKGNAGVQAEKKMILVAKPRRVSNNAGIVHGKATY